MKTNAIFIDAMERNRQVPGTYPVPTDEQKRKIWKRDSVKIGVESSQDRYGNTQVFADESFWVGIVEMQGTTLKGTIKTDPRFTAQHGLKHGDAISFEQRHIMEAHIYDCPQCKHRDQMGYDIPADELTPGIAELLCPNCRAELSFEKLGCPISHEQLDMLCDYVEDELKDRECDHTLRAADEFCRLEGLPAEAMLSWLRKHGGYCDCEVLLNVASRWSE